ELLEHGHIRRPYLGLAMQTVSIPNDVRDRLKLQSETGLMVMQVEADGPANKAGVMLGDVIISIHGKAAGDVADALAGLRTGDPAKLVIVRGGGRGGVGGDSGGRPNTKK